MKQFGLSIFSVMAAVMLFGCGGGSDGSADLQSSKDITVIDGYVADGNVTDSSGQQAVADADAAGVYHFAALPTYPIYFTAGTGYIVDTNMTMDINMSAASGSVISPVTTLAENNGTIITNLAAALHYADPSKLFSDYIAGNDMNLSKLAQLCYAMLKDTNATGAFLSSITTGFNATADANISALITHTLRRDAHKTGTRLFLIKLRDYNGTLADMETDLSDYKADVAYSYPVADKTALQALISAYTADDTNATLAKQVIYADTSAVTDMSNLFSANRTFNLAIGGWDTSNVTNMFYIFGSATAFNQPIGDWDMSNVTNMGYMFGGATAFDQPIGDWNTSNVTDMRGVFSYASGFNHPIGGWNTSNVTNMNLVFEKAYAFNQPLGGWDTSKVTTFSSTFISASSFDQNISDWNVTAAGTNYTSFDTGCPIQGTQKIPRAWWGIPGL